MTVTICLTVGIYAPERIKEVGDTVSVLVLVLMNNFHNSTENKLCRREPGIKKSVKKLSLRKKVSYHLFSAVLCQDSKTALPG